MPKYVIERRIPNAGEMNADELRNVCAKSNGVLAAMTGEGKEVEWLHSYVTGDAIHCIYEAANPEVIREHAQRGGFPADAILEVRETISPATGR